MQKILITGISGFVGTHLAVHLHSMKHRVYGFDQIRMSKSIPYEKEMTFHIGDINDRESIKRVLLEVNPDVIHHLIGILKSENFNQFYSANVLGTINLFEALTDLGLRPKVHFLSSSAVYGHGGKGKPVSETSPVRPATHYAVSKKMQETAAFYYFHSHKIPVYCSRPFNLLGPGQSPGLACSAFARQIAFAESTGETDSIEAGNLSTYRDFIDVRDAVRAFQAIISHGQPGRVYNVCSGKAVSLKSCLDFLIKQSCRQLKVSPNEVRHQAQDIPFQVGNAQRLIRRTGWKPEIAVEQSLQDLLEYWRTEIKRNERSTK